VYAQYPVQVGASLEILPALLVASLYAFAVESYENRAEAELKSLPAGPPTCCHPAAYDTVAFTSDTVGVGAGVMGVAVGTEVAVSVGIVELAALLV
jgi:hypothetical protein